MDEEQRDEYMDDGIRVHSTRQYEYMHEEHSDECMDDKDNTQRVYEQNMSTANSDASTRAEIEQPNNER
jgi:hypothetical protein